MATALLFPGQGSQVRGMRATVAAARPDLLDLAIELAGDDPFERLDEGTRYAQPAICAASLALWSTAAPQGGEWVAGHSLGEVAALAAAGSLSEEDALRIAAERGRLMQDAALAGPAGGMLALLGDGGAPEALAAELARDHGLAVANDNAPGQVVVSGPATALDRAEALARATEIRAVRLSVQGAFHSPGMSGAAPRLAAFLARVPVSPPQIPVLSCITAAPFDDVRAGLVAALTNPVRWRETLLELHRRGAREFVEVGPGKVLKGLVRRTLPDAHAATLAELEPAGA